MSDGAHDADARTGVALDCVDFCLRGNWLPPAFDFEWPPCKTGIGYAFIEFCIRSRRIYGGDVPGVFRWWYQWSTEGLPRDGQGLAERFARGEIDSDEYHQRLQALRAARH